MDVESEEVIEEHAVSAIKAFGDCNDDDILFDTGCTAHILKSAKGQLDLRKAIIKSKDYHSLFDGEDFILLR